MMLAMYPVNMLVTVADEVEWCLIERKSYRHVMVEEA